MAHRNIPGLVSIVRLMILAAGGVIERPAKDGVEILLVHRTRYSDDEWSLPKGKAEEGESLQETAVREVREETGCEVRVAEFLGITRYQVKGQPKEVSYWRMELVQQKKIQDTREIAALQWLPPGKALDIMSYPIERQFLARVYGLREKERS